MHNYQRKLLAMIADGRLTTVQSSTATIRHDRDCGIFARPPRECDCDPDITVRPGLHGPDADAGRGN